MTEMYDRTILDILQKATTAAVEASTTPDLPVKYIGRTFLVPDDQKYLEVVFLPNNQPNGHWGNERNYQGMLRLVLHWRNEDRGVYPAMDVLASICSYFSKENPLSGVVISDNPSFGGVLEEGAELLLPAGMRYQCFRP